MYNKFTHYYYFSFVGTYSHDSHLNIDEQCNFFRAYAIAMQIGDKTGRLLKYDQRTKKVTVLLRGLSFSNGVSVDPVFFAIMRFPLKMARLVFFI